MIKDIAALRQASHRFSDGSFEHPGNVVEWMGAMQAQEFTMAKWAVGVRLPWATDTAVQAAFDRGEFLRTHVMRPTWHFVTPANIRWMLALTAPRIISLTRANHNELELDERLCGRCEELIARILSGGRSLTREQMGLELEQAGVRITHSLGTQGSRGKLLDRARLTNIMIRAELDAIVCSGPMQGGKQTYALFDERVPRAPQQSRDEALAMLARNYFRSHAPASPSDFAWWSGLSAVDVRQAVGAVRAEFDCEGDYLFNRNFGHAATGNALLLPAFDEYIVAYRDRSAVLTAERHTRAVSSNGIFRPVIVERGRVVGLWRRVVKGKRVVAVPEFFDGAASVDLSLALADFNAFVDEQASEMSAQLRAKTIC
ncbi:MAG: winged helix DNA-binding domain-containing protein [Rikenellaceae bacterium]|jgi:hypothetical protein|nr:winged helix DNA-binding domain-containing protein [Rikenellaceae bacterium]